MSTVLAVGSRLPAFHTSMGRIQLGFLNEDDIWRRLRTVKIEARTPSTITDLRALVERIREDRRQGFSIVDEELERGLRSIAVPLVGRDGHCVAALNVSANSHRTTRNEMRDRYLPALSEAARQISRSIA
jgi:IclR family pca regulon transcriptional regulator